MVVVSGQGATIRFGVADQNTEDENNGPHEEGGLELEANLGDVFILPAGVAHKTYNPKPDAPGLKFMAPENVSDASSSRKYFGDQEVTGEFMMMGAYPEGGVWDFLVGGEHKGRFEEVWGVEKPAKDPVLGIGSEGICELWNIKDIVT